MANFPVFQFNSGAFPLLTEQQTSPFGGVLSDSIAKRLAMAKAQSAEAEVPYAGLSALAGAMSKGAYAANSPIQSLVKTMMNDPSWYNMTESQQKNALNAVINNAQNQAGISPIFNTLINKELEKLQGGQNNQGGSFLSRIAQAISGNSAPGAQSSAPSVTSGAPNMQSNALGAVNSAPNQEWPVIPESRGSQPQTLTNVQNAKRALAQSQAEGTATGTQSAKQLELAQQASTTALNMDQLIDSAVNKYNKSWFKGPVLGGYAEYGPDASQALKDTSAMAIQMADSLFGPGSSDAKQAAATNLKLNMKDPPKAFNEFATKMKAQNDRIKWQGTFYQTAKQLGITEPAERDQLWYDYNAKYPPYDYKNHKPIYKNLGLDQNQMTKFITQQRAQQNSFNKRIESTLKENNASEENNFVNQNNKKGKQYASTFADWSERGMQPRQMETINGKRIGKFGNKWINLD